MPSAIAVIAIRHPAERSSPRAVRAGWLVYGICAGAALVHVALALHPRCDGAWAQAYSASSRDALLIFASVLVAPPCEELIYRDMLRNLLRKWLAPGIAVALCALLFSLSHLPGLLSLATPQRTAWLGALFVMGLIFGAAREWHGLPAAIAAHAASNAVFYLIPPGIRGAALRALGLY